jgi:hypothetical protein
MRVRWSCKTGVFSSSFDFCLKELPSEGLRIRFFFFFSLEFSLSQQNTTRERKNGREEGIFFFTQPGKKQRKKGQFSCTVFGPVVF